MDEVKQRTRSVHAFLLESAPRAVEGAELILGVRHKFHMENLQEVKNRRVVEEALARVLGAPLRLRPVLDETMSPPPRLSPPGSAPQASDTPERGSGSSLVEEAVRRFGAPVQEIRRLE